MNKLILIWRNQAIFQEKQINGWLSFVNLKPAEAFSFNIGDETFLGPKDMPLPVIQLFRDHLKSLF